MSQIVNANYAIAYDGDNNITGYGVSPAGEIEFPSNADFIFTFDNESDFKAAMQPFAPVVATPVMKLSDNMVAGLAAKTIVPATSNKLAAPAIGG